MLGVMLKCYSIIHRARLTSTPSGSKWLDQFSYCVLWYHLSPLTCTQRKPSLPFHLSITCYFILHEYSHIGAVIFHYYSWHFYLFLSTFWLFLCKIEKILLCPLIIFFNLIFVFSFLLRILFHKHFTPILPYTTLSFCTGPVTI